MGVKYKEVNMKVASKYRKFLCVMLVLLFFAVSFYRIGINFVPASAISSDGNAKEKSFESSEKNKSYIANFDSETTIASYPQKVKPQTFGNHDADYYPSVDNVLSVDSTKMDELINESIDIYSQVESDIQQNTLKKHNSADGQFYGTVSDDADRVTKVVTINHMLSSRHWLGVFAPAGEILTVTVDQKAIYQTKDNKPENQLSIIIGYPFAENNISRVSSTDDRYERMQNAGRMPYLQKEFKLTSTETKIGSPFGGMVFLSNVPGTIKQNFKITIDGGVDNPSYKFGVSEKSDWQKVLASPSPMVYIQTPYVNFMAPKSAVQNVEDPDNALTFWNNAAMLSNYAMSLDTLSEQIRPVIMMFDNFVPGGSALCYPGLFAAICPTNWVGGSLDYKNMITTTGGWGTIHEMNHNFQYPLKAGYHGSRQWSVGDKEGDFMEITNNVNNVMAFILYTDIASSRTETVAPSNGGWGVTVDPYYNLSHLLTCTASLGDKIGFGNLGGNRIYAYVDIIHSFGVNAFLHFLRQMSGGEPTDYLEKSQTLEQSSTYMRTEDHFAIFASKYFHRDMVDYFKNTLHFNLSDDAITQIQALDYEKHVSIQNLYAMGEPDALTGKPFLLDSNQNSAVLKLKEKTVTTADHFEITSVSDVVGGSVIDNQDDTYTLNFATNSDEVTFNINYNVWFDSDATRIQKTLKVCIQKPVNFSIEATEYKYNKAQDGTNIRDLIASKTDDDIERQYRAGNLSTSVTSGDTFTRLRANVIFPKDQNVTFMVYGDDVTALRIGDEIVVCNTCVTDYFEFYYYNQIVGWTDNKITVAAKANQPILIEAFCLNTGGGGWLKVSYSVGESAEYSGVMLTDCINAQATQSEIEEYIEQEKNPHVYDTVYDLQENALDKFYTNNLSRTEDIKSLKAVNEQGNPVKNPADSGHVVGNIYDGRDDTWFSVPVRSYPLPHYYIFEFNDRVSINNATVQFYDSSYAIRQFSYWIGDSEEKTEWTHILDKDNSKSEKKCVDDFPTVTGRYFIIKVTQEGTNGSTNFVEVTFSQALEKEEKTNIYSSEEKVFNYSQNWNGKKGGYINGVAQTTQEGEVSFVLNGKDLLLYSENDESEVFIDDDKYTVKASDDIGKPSLFVQGLTDELHAVKIVGKNMAFDAVKTTGEIYPQTNLTDMDLQIADFEYDSTDHKPIITADNKVLTENVDYVIRSCPSGQKVGEINFEIEGIGFYKGTFAATFKNILNVENVQSENINVGLEESYTFSGSDVEPKPAVTIEVDGQIYQLSEGVDYDIEYANNSEPGTATLNITFKGNYKGAMQLKYLIEKPSMSVGIIIGIVCGGVVAIALAITLALALTKKKRKKFSKE